MGVKHFCIGWDVRILADWWDTKGAEMRELWSSRRRPSPRRSPSEGAAREWKVQRQERNYA